MVTNSMNQPEHVLIELYLTDRSHGTMFALYLVTTNLH